MPSVLTNCLTKINLNTSEISHACLSEHSKIDDEDHLSDEEDCSKQNNEINTNTSENHQNVIIESQIAPKPTRKILLHRLHSINKNDLRTLSFDDDKDRQMIKFFCQIIVNRIHSNAYHDKHGPFALFARKIIQYDLIHPQLIPNPTHLIRVAMKQFTVVFFFLNNLLTNPNPTIKNIQDVVDFFCIFMFAKNDKINIQEDIKCTPENRAIIVEFVTNLFAKIKHFLLHKSKKIKHKSEKHINKIKKNNLSDSEEVISSEEQNDTTNNNKYLYSAFHQYYDDILSHGPLINNPEKLNTNETIYLEEVDQLCSFVNIHQITQTLFTLFFKFAIKHYSPLLFLLEMLIGALHANDHFKSILNENELNHSGYLPSLVYLYHETPKITLKRIKLSTFFIGSLFLSLIKDVKAFTYVQIITSEHNIIFYYQFFQRYFIQRQYSIFDLIQKRKDNLLNVIKGQKEKIINHKAFPNLDKFLNHYRKILDNFNKQIAELAEKTRDQLQYKQQIEKYNILYDFFSTIKEEIKQNWFINDIKRQITIKNSSMNFVIRHYNKAKIDMLNILYDFISYDPYECFVSCERYDTSGEIYFPSNHKSKDGLCYNMENWSDLKDIVCAINDEQIDRFYSGSEYIENFKIFLKTIIYGKQIPKNDIETIKTLYVQFKKFLFKDNISKQDLNFICNLFRYIFYDHQYIKQFTDRNVQISYNISNFCAKIRRISPKTDHSNDQHLFKSQTSKKKMSPNRIFWHFIHYLIVFSNKNLTPFVFLLEFLSGKWNVYTQRTYNLRIILNYLLKLTGKSDQKVPQFAAYINQLLNCQYLDVLNYLDRLLQTENLTTFKDPFAYAQMIERYILQPMYHLFEEIIKLYDEAVDVKIKAYRKEIEQYQKCITNNQNEQNICNKMIELYKPLEPIIHQLSILRSVIHMINQSQYYSCDTIKNNIIQQLQCINDISLYIIYKVMKKGRALKPNSQIIKNSIPIANPLKTHKIIQKRKISEIMNDNTIEDRLEKKIKSNE